MTSEQELNEKWNNRKLIEETIKSFHTEPAPETRERLKALEVELKSNTINFMEKLSEFSKDNKEAHDALFKAISKLEEKLDKAIEKKADKDLVEKMQSDLESLKDWKWKMVGVGIVVVFIIYLAKDIILSKL